MILCMYSCSYNQGGTSGVQGLITNDTNRLQQDETPVLYAAMLNNKGRQLYDMMLHRDASDSTAVLLDCPAEAAPNLTKLLLRYKLRSQVTIDDASADYSVLCAWQSSSPSPQEAGVTQMIAPAPCCATLSQLTVPPVPGSSTTARHVALLAPLVCDEGRGFLADPPQHLSGIPADPRLSALGLRGPVSKPDEAQLCSSSLHTNEHGSTEDLYVQHRFSLGVAEGTAEVPEGAVFSFQLESRVR